MATAAPPVEWPEFEAWAEETLHPRRKASILRALRDFFSGTTFGGLGLGFGGDRASELRHGYVTSEVARHRDNHALAERRYGASRTPECALRHWIVFCVDRRAARVRATLSVAEWGARAGGVSNEELAFFADEEGEGDEEADDEEEYLGAAMTPASGVVAEGFEGLYAEVAYIVEEALAETLNGNPLPLSDLKAIATRSALRRALDAVPASVDRAKFRCRSKVLEIYERQGAQDLSDLLSGATLREFLASRQDRFQLVGLEGQKHRKYKLAVVEFQGRDVGAQPGCEVGARFFEAACHAFVADARMTTVAKVDVFAQNLLAGTADACGPAAKLKGTLFVRWLKDSSTGRAGKG